MPNQNYKPLKCGGLQLVSLLSKPSKKRSNKAGATCAHEKPLFSNGKPRNFCFECSPKPKSKDRKEYKFKAQCSSACVTCGLVFSKTQYHKKYCSDICRNRSCNVASQVLAINRSERPCRCCGLIFTPEYGNKNKLQCSNECLLQFRAAQHQRRIEARKACDPVFKIIRETRIFISRSIGRNGYAKQSRTHEILGCDWDFFKAHIERQFLKGMTWDNRAEWHIDHIQPMAIAETEEDAFSLNHFTNLRPMWAMDNILKSDKRTHLI